MDSVLLLIRLKLLPVDSFACVLFYYICNCSLIFIGNLPEVVVANSSTLSIQPSTMSSVSPSMSTSTSMTTTVSSTTSMCVSLLFLFCLFYNCCNLKLFNVKHLKVIIHIANLAYAVSIIGTNDIIIIIGYYCVIITCE